MKVSEIVEKLLEHQGLEDRMLMHRAMQAWGQVVGPLINRHTLQRRVDGAGTLLVHIDSGPMRQELSMHKAPLLKALNAAAGKDVLLDIRFI